MPKFNIEWEVWEQGTPEDGLATSNSRRLACGGVLGKEGASAEALHAEWLRLIKPVYPELTATTTREYIFNAVPVPVEPEFKPPVVSPYERIMREHDALTSPHSIVSPR